MSGRVRLDPRAAEELDQAADWYEHQRAGLGVLVEVRDGMQHVVDVHLNQCLGIKLCHYHAAVPFYRAERRGSESAG